MPDPLLAHIRESFGRVVYSHKVHEKEREIQTRISTLSKFVNILLSAITLGGLVATLSDKVPGAIWVSVIVGTLNAGYLISQVSFDPLRQAGLHRAAAKQLLAVRDGYQTLIADYAGDYIDAAEARARRDALESLAQEAFRLAPDTSSRAYKLAKRGLNVDEEMTFSAAEIDAFLPEGMRLGDGTPNGLK